MAIVPAFQKKGIARKMIEYGLQAAGELGHATVFVCGHTDFYQEIGFVPHVGIVGGKRRSGIGI
ncbi:GNAT family N-acetyltransferase [Paenibacillus odorifer]|uniref:GNAT family N-acetyltransferase n=1 Tax=Paenibacillus odorifer TaxID=189426 RepID=UPI0015C2FF15|nr:GNAT family N-acetyltransferase [Paenibacillus odorifer]